MKKVQSNEAKELKNSDTSKLLEYSIELKDKDIDLEYKVLPTSSGYNNKLTVRILTQNSSFSISGTVFGESELRIIDLNGFRTDFKPKGKMIITKNQDIPGFIADISGILAKNHINIADFRLGRDGYGYALAVILIDEKADDKLLEQINDLEACSFAKYAEL